MLVNELYSDIKCVRELGDDELIVVADIRGSTLAGQSGRGREVNYVGAACISVILNGFPNQRIPYVFGGDGATFIVHSTHCQRVIALLEQVQAMALTQYDLTLRIGTVSAREIRQRGAELFVGECARGEAIFYQFMGGGFALADSLVKERCISISKKEASEGKIDSLNLAGLSCRLLPFRSLNGSVYTVVIESSLPSQQQDKMYREVLALLNVRLDLQSVRPIQIKNMKRRWLPTTFRIEAKAALAGKSFFSKLKSYVNSIVENILTTFVFKVKKYSVMTGNVHDYEKALLIQNDWIKLGGLMTLVLDLSEDDYLFCETLLQNYEASGMITYGSHVSDAAVMVCQVFANDPSNHLHFVDGAGCGLAAAATQLKNKRSQSKIQAAA